MSKKYRELDQAISWLAKDSEANGKKRRRLQFAWSEWSPWFDDAPCEVSDELKFYLTRCLFDKPLNIIREVYAAKEIAIARS